MSEKKEPARPEARLPKGLFDTSAAEIRATERMLATIRQVFESYGFEPLDTPSIEYSDALGKFLPDQDRPNEGVFSFKDADDGEWLSLRYDLTAPLARYVAENYQNLPKPFRRYQVGPVWRNEKPGPGRFRQFTQFDADTVGASSVAADAELCMLAADTLEALGVGKEEYDLRVGHKRIAVKDRPNYVVKISNRKVLDGLREVIGLSDSKHDQRWLTAMRALDKYDRLGIDGVCALLGEGRKDESGDFTKGAHLDRACIVTLTSIFEPIEDPEEKIAQIDIRLRDSEVGQQGRAELETMWSLAVASGYDDGRIKIDPSVVRGLEYYTGPVFEAELLSPIKDERGQPIRLGSVVSGGRYDGLIERFTGEKVPATGISIGVSRLLFGLEKLDKLPEETTQGPVVVAVFPDVPIENYQRLVHRLRHPDDGGKPIAAEMYLGSGKLGAQMKYADKRGSPCVVIQGGDEMTKGKLQIKDLVLGATLTSIKDRDEYLKQQAKAQFLADENDLVKEVRGVLARRKA